MMSRITLHLRRTAHKQDNFNSSYDLTSSMMTASGRPRSPIAFAHRLPTINSANNTPFTISIQSQTVMHDDHGDIVETPKSASSVAFGKGTTRRDEWHELGPVSPVRLNINASHGSAESSPDIDKVMAV